LTMPFLEREASIEGRPHTGRIYENGERGSDKP
jgi:hypothetical protein